MEDKSTKQHGGIVRLYDGAEVTFNAGGWFNATQVAARFGKRPVDWLENKETREYIAAVAEILNVPNSALLKAKRGAAGGTWMHPRLGVAFARWLDPRFAAWADEQIDQILRGQLDTRRARHEAAATYKVVSAILQETRADKGKATADHHYQNEARLINWALAGKFKSLDRDALSYADLDLLARLEARDAVLLGRGYTYDQRKAALKAFADDLRALPAANAPHCLEVA